MQARPPDDDLGDPAGHPHIRPDTPISGREPPHPAPGSITFGPESTTFRPVASRSPGNHHIPAWSPY